ncbi:DUF397 domain-containing protein [Streptomyces sp. NBC_00385]|uniref:DUF397 domain-containing protein n=1 Tax=Streptomyces sp. NBC_00385 TaxID=2975733 RepID=UPI002DD8AD49|nr:DUF397 domain-containing protein [Streptomyces sp. NBC_00385]WRZ04497.1 DUF397 domain-containing protein [Streptomyces sp. NBC_00385]
MNRRASVQGVSGLVWFKSSYSSDGNEGDCVETATAPGAMHVRDSKNLSGPQLTFGETAWAGFVPYVAGR